MNLPNWGQIPIVFDVQGALGSFVVYGTRKGLERLPTHHPRIMKAYEDFLPLDELQSKLNVLNGALDVNNVPLIRTLLKDMVPGYQPDGAVVDWVWMENEKLA
jgi:hypothetical protein